MILLLLLIAAWGFLISWSAILVVRNGDQKFNDSADSSPAVAKRRGGNCFAAPVVNFSTPSLDLPNV